MDEEQPRRSLTDLAGLLDEASAEAFERAIDEADAEHEAALERSLERFE